MDIVAETNPGTALLGWAHHMAKAEQALRSMGFALESDGGGRVSIAGRSVGTVVHLAVRRRLVLPGTCLKAVISPRQVLLYRQNAPGSTSASGIEWLGAFATEDAAAVIGGAVAGTIEGLATGVTFPPLSSDQTG